MKYEPMAINDIMKKYGNTTLAKYKNQSVFDYYKQDDNLNNKGLNIKVMAYESYDVLPDEIKLHQLLHSIEQIELNNTIIY